LGKETGTKQKKKNTRTKWIPKEQTIRAKRGVTYKRDDQKKKGETMF